MSEENNNPIASAIDEADYVPFDLDTDCPFTPIGKRQGRFWILTPDGELRDCTHRDLTKVGILALLDGHTQWLNERFPVLDRKGGVIAGVYDHIEAARYIIQSCSHAGLYDEMQPVRGRGVWNDGKARLVVHYGDRVEIDGEMVRPGVEARKAATNAIYPSAPPIPGPASEPATREEAQQIYELFSKWNYENDLGAELITGWVAAAMLGAAPAWRAHIMVNGQHGVGKTELKNAVAGALGGCAHPPANNVTQAGLAQALTGESRVVIVDEAENDPNGQAVKMVELTRQMSAGDGARMMRGSAEGKAHTYTLAGSVFLACITPPPFKAQDESRFVILRLRPLSTGPGTEGQWQTVMKLIDRVTALSPKVWRRMVDAWPRFQECLGRYRAIMMTNHVPSRVADQLSVVLAGRDVLLNDEPISTDEIEIELERFAPMIEEARLGAEDNEGQDCLRQLLGSDVDSWRSGNRKIVSQLYLDAFDPVDDLGARKMLGAMGLRVVHEGDRDNPGKRMRVAGRDNAVLLVANKHVALDRLYSGTRWAGGGWRSALMYLEGVKPWPRTVRFAGQAERCVAIPAKYLPVEEVEPDTDAARDVDFNTI